MTFSPFRNAARWLPAVSIALGTLAAFAGPSAAETAPDWMDGTSQWAVGYVEDGPQSYCTLLWNSEIGRTVELRQGLKSASLRLSDTTWNFQANAPARIVLASRTRMLAIDATADASNSVSTSDHGNVVRAIIQNAISGTVDLSLAVGDKGDQWDVPISRIYSMHHGVSQCLKRVAARAAAAKLQPADDASTDF